ncbi:MAG: hypothetical protein ACI9N3_001205 [Colwellia sp.]|jgi:hypothetical protein
MSIDSTPSSPKQASPLLDFNGHVFEVNKNNLHKTQVAPLTIQQTLVDNEVILKVDKFALTTNNISYGIKGDALGYWRFFPPQSLSRENKSSDNQWGRLPVMGIATVISSNNDQIQVGEKVWGFMPMATHVKILAGRISDSGFSDISPYRDGLATLYAAFERVKSNPFYSTKNENYEILVRGLFITSWLVDDFMDDNQYFGASQYLITSASSKTSIALAFAVKKRGKHPSMGITSSKNKEFVESLGCYDKVISYDEITHLNADIPSILVDMAGSKTTLTAIHCHFTEQLRYSCRIGATHHNDMLPADIAKDSGLPGAVPTFFFAPTQLKKRTKDWGSNETMKQIGLALLDYIEFCRSVMSIEHTTNKNDIDVIYQRILSGNADASKGQVVSL